MYSGIGPSSEAHDEGPGFDQSVKLKLKPRLAIVVNPCATIGNQTSRSYCVSSYCVSTPRPYFVTPCVRPSLTYGVGIGTSGQPEGEVRLLLLLTKLRF